MDALQKGMNKAYALFFTNYCTRAMQSRIEEHPEFATKLKNDPIATLEAIKNPMHDSVRAQYPLVSMVDALGRLINVRQQENEHLLDYVKRFKQLRDVVKSQLGTKILDEFTEHQAEFRETTSEDEKTEMKKEAFEKWMAYLIIRGSDQAKYGSLVKGFVSQYSLGNDQYPKTITTAIDVLSNHRLGGTNYEKRNRERAVQEKEEEKPVETSFAQRKILCYCCGAEGHTSPTCPDRNKIPRDKWAVNKAVQHMQGSGRSNDNEDNRLIESATSALNRNGRSGERQGKQDRHVEWNGFQNELNLVNNQGDISDKLKDVIILDTGSTLEATFMNPDLVTGIRKSKTPMMMATNAGSKKIDLVGSVNSFGDVWYDPTQMANIFGFSHVVDKWRVTYDSAKEDAFLVHKDTGIVKFERTPERLYAYKPSQKYLKSVAESKNMLPAGDVNVQVSNLVSTVSENQKGYTQRQFENAKRARKLYHILGCPTVENFKHILRQKIIKNCPVTIDDVNIAEKIFGPDIGAMKGKNTRHRPTPVKDDLVEIPKELREQHANLTLCMDIMYVNGMPMLTAIDRSIKYRSLIPLDSRVADKLYKGLDKIFRLYNNAGHLITSVNCDGEFRSIMDDVADDLDVKMNYTARSEHVPEAERNNRTIGERIRATYHNLPYKAIPRIMLRHLAMVCTKQLNYFPAKGGVSSYLSPHVILTSRDLDYEVHCQVPFGAYVQVNQENIPTNTPAPRTIDAIYLRPMSNKQGGHEVMNLATGQVITRTKVWERPVTELVIKAVETMAAEQGIKTLKLEGQNKVPLFPADWIAGVDYEDRDQSDDEDDEEYKENNINEDVEYGDDVELDDDAAYDRIDQEEINEIIAEPGGNPAGQVEQGEDDESNPTAGNETDEDDVEVEEQPTRPVRVRHPVERLTYTHNHNQVKFEDQQWFENELKHSLFAQTGCLPKDKEKIEYSPQVAMVAARFISDINEKTTRQGASFAQQYMLKKGLRKFGESGTAAASKELDQLHKRNCFTPIDVSTLTADEKKKAVDALMFLTEKRDKTVKGRMVYNGKPTREWLSREDSASPTAALESIMLTAIVDAKEGRDVMTADIPNAFIQMDIPKSDERVVM